MVRIRVPAVLRSFVGGAAVIEVDAATLADLPVAIRATHPQLAARLLSDEGTFKEFVNVFVGADDARQLDPSTPLRGATEVILLPAVSGG